MNATQFDRDLYCLRQAGYVVLPGFAAPEDVRRLVSAGRRFEVEVQAYVDAGGSAILRHSWPLRTTRCLYAIAREFQDLAMDPRLHGFATAYLGKTVLRDCLLQTVMPDARNARRGKRAAVSFHRDTLWTSDAIVPSYLHAFVVLDDVTAANGATIVVPGTHRSREPGYYFKQTDPREPEDGIDYRVYERRYFPSAVALEATAGSLILLDPMTIHTQGNNVTRKPRSLVNVMFRRADVVARPPLLNAKAIAERCARVPVRRDLIELLECDASLPDHFGPLGNGVPISHG